MEIESELNKGTKISVFLPKEGGNNEKITALIILTIILFVLTSCNIESTEISETIKAPLKILSPPNLW